MVAWSILVNIMVFVASFASPWFLLLLLPAAAIPWWSRGTSRPFFLAMGLAVVGTAARVREPLLTLWQLHRQGHGEGVVAGTQLYEEAVARQGLSQLTWPLGVALIAGLILALATEFMARHSPGAGEGGGQTAKISVISKLGYVQLALHTTVLGLVFMVHPGRIVSPADQVLYDIDGAIRSPTDRSRDAVVLRAFSDRDDVPRVGGIALSCMALASRLVSEPLSVPLDMPLLSGLCTRAAVEVRDGFEDNDARVFFWDHACAAPHHLLRDLSSPDEVHLRSQFCAPHPEICSLLPVSSIDGAVEDFVIAFANTCRGGGQRYIAKIDGRELRKEWAVDAISAEGKIRMVGRHLLELDGRRVRTMALDSGGPDGDGLDLPSAIVDLEPSPPGEHLAIARLENNERALIDLRTGSVRRGTGNGSPSWAKSPKGSPNSAEPCPTGLVTLSNARCTLAKAEAPSPMPDGYSSVVTLVNGGNTVVFGAPVVDSKSRTLVVGFDENMNKLLWQHEIDTRDVHVNFDMSPGRVVTLAKKLTAFDAKAGNVLWENSDVLRERQSPSSLLVVSKSRVYVRENGLGRPLQVRDVNTGKLIGTVEGL